MLTKCCGSIEFQADNERTGNHVSRWTGSGPLSTMSLLMLTTADSLLLRAKRIMIVKWSGGRQSHTKNVSSNGVSDASPRGYRAGDLRRARQQHHLRRRSPRRRLPPSTEPPSLPWLQHHFRRPDRLRRGDLFRWRRRRQHSRPRYYGVKHQTITGPV